MPESSQLVNQKTSELETAVAEVQQELSRADATRRTKAHESLAALVKEARDWLEARKSRDSGSGGAAGEEALSADARKAEDFLHGIRMQRAEL